jgi:hypothetical protein
MDDRAFAQAAQSLVKNGPTINIRRVKNGWVVRSEYDDYVFTRGVDVADFVKRTLAPYDIDADAPELPFEEAVYVQPGDTVEVYEGDFTIRHTGE